MRRQNRCVSLSIYYSLSLVIAGFSVIGLGHGAAAENPSGEKKTATALTHGVMSLQGAGVCNELKFRPKSYFDTGLPNELFAEDLDGDGATDLFAPSSDVEVDGTQQRFGFPLAIYFGERNGNLTPGPRLFATLVRQPRYFAVADFNGDGRRDLVLATGAEPEVRLFLGDGARGLSGSVAIEIRTPNLFGYPGALKAVDLNRDGRPDLIALGAGRLFITLNTSTGGNISFAPAVSFSFGGQTLLGIADINHDGLVDLHTLQTLSTQNVAVSVYLGDGLGSFRPQILSPIETYLTQGDFADFNGDGDLDLVTTVQQMTSQGFRYKIGLVYGDGAGRFGQFATNDSFLVDPEQVKILAGDVNGDSRPDALLFAEKKVRAVLTDPVGRPGAAIEVGRTDDFSAGGFVAGDFNGDGRTDFATLDKGRASFVISWNRCATSGLSLFGQTLDRTLPVGLGGVAVRLSGAATAEVATDIGGNYEFAGLAPGDYNVSVERAATTFDPARQSVQNLTTDRALNFSGQRIGTTVSAASFEGSGVAPDSIASIFGLGMSRSSEAARSLPLPISLANQSVSLKDSEGVERPSQLFLVSPNQINFLIPAEAATGPASIHVFSSRSIFDPEAIGTFVVEKVAPGLFSAGSTGRGVAAGLALRFRADGTQRYEPISQLIGSTNVSIPVDLGTETDRVFLILFGTGFRNNAGLSGVSALVGGQNCEVGFAGAQGSFAGLDQINLQLSRTLAGRGETDIVLTIDGKQTNPVRVNIK